MIGLLPCAGTAERFNGLPKYLLPCPNDSFLLREHEWAMQNIVDYGLVMASLFTFDTVVDYALGSVYTADHCATMTQTVISSQSWMQDNQNILFGMPDTYFDFPLVYERLAARLNTSNADVVLAVFKARPEQHRQGGMVSVSHNQVVDIVDKPEVTTLQYIWGAMAWRAAFWQCLAPDMPHVGYGVKVALERGLNVQAVICAGDYYDCGTFERYVEMLKANTGNDKRV